MSGLVDGSTASWDFVAKQLHRDELKKATSGIVAASKPTPRPAEPCVIWAHQTVSAPDAPIAGAYALDDTYRAAAAAAHMQPTVLEQTRLIARLGLAARDLGHAIADNLRRLNAQEDR